MEIRSRKAVVVGDYVRFDRTAVVAGHNTELHVAPGSIRRFVRDARDPAYAVVLLGAGYIRVPRASFVFHRASDGPLPYPWVDAVLVQTRAWARRGRVAG